MKRLVIASAGSVCVVFLGLALLARSSIVAQEGEAPTQAGEVTQRAGTPPDKAGPASQDLKVIDRCCFDLDGEGPPDDGVFAVTRGGEILVALFYEDPDGNKRFDDADQVLAITYGAGPGGRP